LGIVAFGIVARDWVGGACFILCVFAGVCGVVFVGVNAVGGSGRFILKLGDGILGCVVWCGEFAAVGGVGCGE
jgi:hypothetical protein